MPHIYLGVPPTPLWLNIDRCISLNLRNLYYEKVISNITQQCVHVLNFFILLSPRVELSSDEFQRQLQPFLFDQTQHFIHEFTSFAQSPFEMTAYDKRAQYNWPNNESRDQVRDTPTVFHSHTSGVDQLLLSDIIMCVVRLLYSQH